MGISPSDSGLATMLQALTLKQLTASSTTSKPGGAGLELLGPDLVTAAYPAGYRSHGMCSRRYGHPPEGTFRPFTRG
jgi:hypothetical protein